MKKIFLFLLLLVPLSCCAFSQNASKFHVVQQSNILKNSSPFSISTQALQTNIDATIAKVFEDMSSITSVSTQAKYVSFIPESGLYSGFGTAWYRKTAFSFENVPLVNTFEWHCDFFSASLIQKETQKEAFDSSLFQTDLLLSVGYRNSF